MNGSSLNNVAGLLAYKLIALIEVNYRKGYHTCRPGAPTIVPFFVHRGPNIGAYVPMFSADDAFARASTCHRNTNQ